MAAPATFDRLLLVGVRSGLGLRFYLDRPVIHVAPTREQLASGESLYATETVEQVLATCRRDLFLVKRRWRGAFDAAAAGQGRWVETLGDLGNIDVVRLTPVSVDGGADGVGEVGGAEVVAGVEEAAGEDPGGAEQQRVRHLAEGEAQRQ
jgi:hypothetical protein